MAATDASTMRAEYEQGMREIRARFEGATTAAAAGVTGDGVAAARARAALVDGLLRKLWAAEVEREAGGKLARGLALVAVGGYGRAELFPCSDIDLLFCGEKGEGERARDAIRRVTQALWDCGLQVAAFTRAVGECERFDTTNAEFGLALLDRRFVGGDEATFAKLEERVRGRMLAKDAKAIRAELLGLTRERHAKYGNTLFHLEPNVKDCPGGLRDAHVCGWLGMLGGAGAAARAGGEAFEQAVRFLASARCFLHWRHGRDDNTLDWLAQDAAAAAGVGLARAGSQDAGTPAVDPARWMRSYFRQARAVERELVRMFEASGAVWGSQPDAKRLKGVGGAGYRLRDGRVHLEAAGGKLANGKLADGADVAGEPEVVLAAFAAVAATGARMDAASEERIEAALPRLSANLEEGPGLWRRLAAILVGRYAGVALRAMHALGLLELILPEFHGIDALVIRDAYHRYTVDEHTFVLIDTLHGLEDEAGAGAPDWRVKFGSMVRELGNPALLYLAALMHDTGKGRSGDDHAAESARLARDVLRRLEMDPYDAGMVLRLIELHLEMSAALRRDIFDAAAVKAFAAKVTTPELLRMLTLFTYADIQAVHPDALTPWKAENLWRLCMHASNQLDRNVDDERVHTRGADESVVRVLALAGAKREAVREFLEGFPERYLRTRSAERILAQFAMAQELEAEPFQIAFHYGNPAAGSPVSEITLVTRDRPRLFAGMAAALAAWGMNVVTADAFSNASGIVVDSFRFTDTFRTLELNESERGRFVESVRELVAGRASVEKMLSSRRRARRRAPRVVVDTRVEFDETASTHSTLLQVIAQDVPGLLRAISQTVSEAGFNVEVALVDTEGETAIDVFYLTHDGARLTGEEETTLRARLVEAIEANAG